MMRKRHLHRTRITAASGAPEVETVWCGALNGLCVTSVPLHALLALCTFVTIIRSSIVSGGKIQGIRRASMVFPEPGGPLMTICVPFATVPKLRLLASLQRYP
jgi:hypothetical protein